jgi:hypothetical protein
MTTQVTETVTVMTEVDREVKDYFDRPEPEAKKKADKGEEVMPAVVTKWSCIPVGADTPKYSVRTTHGSVYGMRGCAFQDEMVHGVDKSAITKGRISLTYRLSRVMAGIIGYKPDNDMGRNYTRIECFDAFGDITWDDIMRELHPSLKPDRTFNFGKWYENDGRMSSDLVTTRMWKPEWVFEYTYSRNTNKAGRMGPIVEKIRQQLEMFSGQPLDWVHVTVYPTGQTKLGEHSDKDKFISDNTDIFGVTFMEERDAMREVYFLGRASKKTRTKPTAHIVNNEGAKEENTKGTKETKKKAVVVPVGDDSEATDVEPPKPAKKAKVVKSDEDERARALLAAKIYKEKISTMKKEREKILRGLEASGEDDEE